MKILFMLLFLLISNFCFSQKIVYDTKLIGCFKGSEENQQEAGMSKYWISCRYEGGKSLLLFIAIDKDGDVEQVTEDCLWWTENGKYFEFHKNDKVTDIYNYNVLENGDVKFKSIEFMGKPYSSYEFIDYKIKNF